MFNRFAPAKTAQRRATWCGPYAIGVIAEMDYDDAYEICTRSLLRYRPIRGMSNVELMRSLKNAGCKFRQWSYDECGRPATQNVPNRYVNGVWEDRWIPVRVKQTLTQWRDSLTPEQRRKTYIVNVTGHYVVYSCDRIIDNQQPTWQAFGKRRKHKRSIVRVVFEIEED